MSDTDTMQDALELAALLRPYWPEFDTGPVVCEGDDDGDGSDDDGSDDTSGDDGDDGQGDADGKDAAAEAAKWKALARKHEAQAKSNADKAKQFDDLEESKKSEVTKAADKAAAAEKRAAEAERKLLQIEVALDKAPEGLPLAKVRGLSKRLAGASREEFEADADELFADFKPDTGDDDPKPRPKGGRPGAVPKAKPDENDPAKLADAVPRGW